MKSISLNENGKSIWYRYGGRLTLVREYDWIDNMTLIDEENNRRVITAFKWSTFDFEDWTPMTQEQYKEVCSGKKLWNL